MLFIFDLDDTLYDTSGRLDEKKPNFTEMKLHEGARKVLESVAFIKILVTHGEKDIQEKKIDTLKVRQYFDEIYICENRTDKFDIFKKILEKYKTAASKEVFVIGDRIDSEIKYGNMLGMTTINLSRGKYINLEPKDETEIPNLKIRSLEELITLC